MFQLVRYNSHVTLGGIVTHLTTVKWVAASLMVAATLMMISPTMAGVSILPWMLYGLSNLVWGYDSWLHDNRPWMWLAVFFVLWDIAIIIQRLTIG